MHTTCTLTDICIHTCICAITVCFIDAHSNYVYVFSYTLMCVWMCISVCSAGIWRPVLECL